MARPLKEGLDYFPLDCVMDDKIEALESELGIEAFGVYIRILQSIYRMANGEINLNSSEFSMWKILEKRIGKTEEYLREAILLMVNIGLFDKEMYENGILTSNGIKKRIDAVSSDRKHARERKNYHAVKLPNNSRTRGESKVKKSKGKESIFKPPTLEEAQQYCSSVGIIVDCEDFIAFYQSKGWKVGKEKMKDWQSAIRRAAKWEKNIVKQEEEREITYR